MAKKRRIKRVRVKRGNVVRRVASGTANQARALAQASKTLAGVQAPRKERMKIVLRNLFLFAILFILSAVIAGTSSDVVVQQSFWILAILTGFVAVALIIVVLVLLFMRKTRR